MAKKELLELLNAEHDSETTSKKKAGLYGYDLDNTKWRRIAVNANGQVKIDPTNLDSRYLQTETDPVASAALATHEDLTGISVHGLGSASTLTSDIDGTLAANSDSKVATQKAVKTYAQRKMTVGSQTDASATYPIAYNTLEGYFSIYDGSATQRVGARLFVINYVIQSPDGTSTLPIAKLPNVFHWESLTAQTDAGTVTIQVKSGANSLLGSTLTAQGAENVPITSFTYPQNMANEIMTIVQSAKSGTPSWLRLTIVCTLTLGVQP